MSFEPLISQLSERLRVFEVKNEVLSSALKDVTDEMKTRIFIFAKDAQNGIIGTSYSKKPYYFAKDDFYITGRFRPQGKNSKRPFANGKVRKTMYLAGGYSEFRQIQGFRTDRVDLLLKGDLYRSLKSKMQGERGLIGIDTKKEAQKSTGLETKYRKSVFYVSQRERNLLDRALLYHINRLLDV